MYLQINQLNIYSYSSRVVTYFKNKHVLIFEFRIAKFWIYITVFPSPNILLNDFLQEIFQDIYLNDLYVYIYLDNRNLNQWGMKNVDGWHHMSHRAGWKLN
jgi:hypothetical protein